MAVREILVLAREAAIEIRRREQEAEIRASLIGMQGHGYEFHAKSGIRDPMRHVIDFMEWQESVADQPDLRPAIEDGYRIVRSVEKVSDPLWIEVVTRYYLQAESWTSIARDISETRLIEPWCRMGHRKAIEQLERSVDVVIDGWERIGLAHIKEMDSHADERQIHTKHEEGE